MNIKICYFTELKAITEYTQRLRENGTCDVIVIIKKSTGRIGLAISGNFLAGNLNETYISENGIDVQRSTVNYGEYGNVLSIPGVTFTVIIPMGTPERFTREYVEAALCRLYGGTTPTVGHNDFMLGERKTLGASVFSDCSQYLVIGSLSRIPSEIDNIYSLAWRESGKVLPSVRIEGYREAVNTVGATIEAFAEALKMRANEQLKGIIQNIIMVDMDEGGE